MMRTRVCWSLAVALAAVAANVWAQEPAKPGPEHALLKKMEGTWDTTMKMGPMESKGNATYTMDLGGLWLLSKFEGSMGDQKFSGRGADSYDAAKKKYVGLWIDSTSTTPMVMEGTRDAATKMLTMIGEGPDMNRKIVKYKAVSRMVDDDTMHFAMFAGDVKDPQFTIVYKRKK
jgi:hypothetical protein